MVYTLLKERDTDAAKACVMKLFATLPPEESTGSTQGIIERRENTVERRENTLERKEHTVHTIARREEVNSDNDDDASGNEATQEKVYFILC